MCRAAASVTTDRLVRLDGSIAAVRTASHTEFLLDLPAVRVCALLEHSGKDQVLVLVCADQPLAIGLVHRNRLLHQHVVACLQEGGNMRRVIVVLAVLGVVATWGAWPPKSQGSWTNKVEVRGVEWGVALGRPGISIRLTLHSGEAVEYRGEDPDEAAAVMRMADLFVNGRARMFAELEGTKVVGIQVAGPRRPHGSLGGP